MSRPRMDLDADTALALLFRSRGFEGVTLSVFERETGMARASLYYRFPEGKDAMARAALDNVLQTLQTGLLAEVDAAEPRAALKLLRRGLAAYYDDGRLGCMLGAFSVPATADKFRPQLLALAAALQKSLEQLVQRLGLPKTQARQRAEDFLVDLQGSLVMAAVNGAPRLFMRRLDAAVAALGKTDKACDRA